VKFIFIITSLLLSPVFAQSNNDVAVIEAKPFGQLACLLGESKVKESDYQLKPITEETDFFTEVAVGAIKQIDLKTAECEAAVGNVKGFSFSCVVKSPLDQQKLFLSYIYKYETKLGLFKLKVGSSKMSLLAKNIFTCMPNSKSLLLATFE